MDNLIEEVLDSKNPSKDFSDENLGCEGATLISNTLPQFPNLTSLNLRKNQIEDQGITAIAEALKNIDIKSLNLSCNIISSVSVTSIANLLQTTKLTSLDLGSNGIGFEGALTLAESLPNSQVTHLNIEYNQILDQGVIAIAEILPQTRLSFLNVANNRLTNQGAIALAETLETSQITHLNLGGNGIKSTGGEAIAKVLELTKITNLDLSYTQIDLDGTLAIAGALKGSQITDLNLCCSSRDFERANQGVEILLHALQGTRLKALNIGELQMTSVPLDMDCIEELQITTLNLSDNMLLDDNLVPFCEILKYTKITLLNLDNNEIEDGGALALARVLRDTRITDLHLKDTQIKQKGARAIAEAIKDMDINCLDIQYNDVGDEGALAIAKVLVTKKKISYLEFRGMGIRNQGALDILNILKGSEITGIDLSRNKITNEGGIGIAEILGDTELVGLKLGQNGIKDYNVIREAIKDTYITDFDQSISKDNRIKVDCIHRKFKNLVSGLDSNPFDYIDLVKIILSKKACFIKHFGSYKNNIYTMDEIKDFVVNIETILFEFLNKLDLAMIEHVKVLLKCEESGLNVVVENLLFNRPNYSLIKSGYDVLHPAVYVLMNKYDKPFYFEHMNPKKNDLIEIFSKDDLDDVIKQNELTVFPGYGKNELLDILLN